MSSCSYCAQSYATITGFDENLKPITADTKHIPAGLSISGPAVKHPHVVPEPHGTAVFNPLTDVLNAPFNAGAAVNKGIDKGLSGAGKGLNHWWDSLTKGFFHGLPVLALVAGGLILLVILMHR